MCGYALIKTGLVPVTSIFECLEATEIDKKRKFLSKANFHQTKN